MTLDELMRHLDQDEPSPVYFLFGQERFYQSEIIAALTRHIVNSEHAEFNFQTFEAKTSNVADWVDAANTYSFFGGRKLVTVRDLHDTMVVKRCRTCLCSAVRGLQNIVEPAAASGLLFCDKSGVLGT